MRYRVNEEIQYKYVKQSLLVEEFLPLTAYTTEGAAEYRFWTVHGSVVYVEVMCGANQYTYVSADFHVLDIEYEVSQPVHMREWEPCVREPVRPRNWAHMLHAVKRLTQQVEGLVRMDLFSDGRERIYLSEYTFTPDSCGRDDSRPKAAQQLVAFLLRHPHALKQKRWLTGALVEGVIGVRPPGTSAGGCMDPASAKQCQRKGMDARCIVPSCNRTCGVCVPLPDPPQHML